MKGYSIFMEFHEQGMGHMIAGFYTPTHMSEEELVNRLKQITSHEEFNERDNVIIIDHTKVMAAHILNDDRYKKEIHVLEKFFPEAMKYISTDKYVSEFTFVFHDEKANSFIAMNRNYQFLQEQLNAELKRKSDAYMEERKQKKENNQE